MDEILKRKRTDEDEDRGNEINKKLKIKQKECVTCCNEVAINRFPKLPHKTAQRHGRDVCFDCWNNHHTSEIQSKAWDQVCCPLCEEVLEETEIKKLVGRRFYQRWLDKAAKACREKDEEFIACPRAECTWGCYFSTKEDGNIFTCHMCKYRQCVLCEVQMHDGETCNDYQERMAADQERKRVQVQQNTASEQTVNTISKPCPNCSARLDKYIGCDHVTCRQCKFQFCWLCSAPYNGPEGILGPQGNRAHRTTCQYYR